MLDETHANATGEGGVRADGAPDHKLGIRLRHARRAMRLRLKDLAEQIACSESMLSKIENDRAVPSLALLHRIAAALNTNVSRLFSTTPQSGFVTRKGQRPVIPASGKVGLGVTFELLTPAPGPTLYQASIHSVEPGCKSDGAIVHDGEDFGFILTGVLELSIGEERHVLNEGDSFAFPSQLPHAYRNPGTRTTQVVWFNTPANF